MHLSLEKSSRKLNVALLVIILSILAIEAGAIVLLLSTKFLRDKQETRQAVLGKLVKLLPTPNPTDSLIRPVQETFSDKKTPSSQKISGANISSPEYKIVVVNKPKELIEGSIATFTWDIYGPATVVNQSVILYGASSTPGKLNKEVTPKDTLYTDILTDFAQGEFTIPLRFIGNLKLLSPGKYYYRVYTLVNGKNYWSDEHIFEVKPREEIGEKEPKGYSIALAYLPDTIKAGEVATFTWDVGGPPATIGHTAIYLGTESKSGILGTDVKPEDIPYNDLVNDFVGGEYNIPLRFIGNKKIDSAGTYYLRAYALIDSKHYWTDEHSFKVSK